MIDPLTLSALALMTRVPGMQANLILVVATPSAFVFDCLGAIRSLFESVNWNDHITGPLLAIGVPVASRTVAVNVTHSPHSMVPPGPLMVTVAGVCLQYADAAPATASARRSPARTPTIRLRLRFIGPLVTNVRALTDPPLWTATIHLIVAAATHEASAQPAMTPPRPAIAQAAPARSMPTMTTAISGRTHARPSRRPPAVPPLPGDGGMYPPGRAPRSRWIGEVRIARS